jgi:predicted amino acid dehydrogenase
MGKLTPSFACIGHQESWEKVTAVLNTLREETLAKLSVDDIKKLVHSLRPHPVATITTRSFPRDIEVLGLYIESFISVDSLNRESLSANLARIKDAAACAIREKVGIASLGGFTSILLEGNTGFMAGNTDVAFTTGNAPTAAYIVKGVEQACLVNNVAIEDSHVLIVGSTGDLGSACVSYFSGRAKSLLLCARNKKRLYKQSDALKASGVTTRASTSLTDLTPEADVVILVASTAANVLDMSELNPRAIVCDAGYPKNVSHAAEGEQNDRVFFGGMGQVLGGFSFSPDVEQAFMDFPGDSIGYGCTLEAPLLALEGRPESFSSGRGRITAETIEEIWSIAQSHGFVLAPLFNGHGAWSKQVAEPDMSPIS